MQPKPNKIKLYTPTELQRQVHQSTAIFRVVVAGRRFGKNMLALNDLMERAWMKPNSKIWWCSLIYPQAKRDYRRLVSFFKSCFTKYLDSELRIELPNNSVIEFKALEKPNNLLGEGITDFYIDEIASVPQQTWENTLMPMLLDNNGCVLMFGTPKGKNWFYKYFMDGQNKINNTESWRFTTLENPYIEEEFYNTIRDKMPEVIARQELDAEFIDSSSSVFQNYHRCIRDNILLDIPIINIKYQIGVDLGKVNDWTVCTIIDANNGNVVAFLRFHGEWSIQKQKIYALAKYWNDAEIVIDSTGIGDPIYEDLDKAGCHIVSFKFTESSRRSLIENLIIKFQNMEIHIPNSEQFPELIQELDMFEYKKMPSGNIRYDHPAGEHDDCVISLALAIWDDGEPRLDTIADIKISDFIVKDILEL